MKTQTSTHLALSLKKLLSLIVVFSMLLSASSAIAYAQPEKEFNYLVLGASETNGYGLKGFIGDRIDRNQFYLNPQKYLKDASFAAGFENTSTLAYPMLIAEKLKEKFGDEYNINLSQYAQSGMRYEELRFLLDPDYAGDEYTKWRFYDGTDSLSKWFPAEYSKFDGVTYEKSITGLRNKYKDAIVNADLITLDLGINSFVTFVFNALLYNMFDVDFADLLDGACEEKFFEVRNKINDALVELSEGKITKADLEKVYAYTDVIPYAYIGYCANFDACIKIIRDLNPDAELVVVGMPKVSGMENVAIGNISLSVDKIFTMLLQSANMYSKYFSPYADLYYYADVADVNVPTLSEDLMAYDGEFLYSEEDWTSLSLDAEERAAKELILSEITECFDFYDSSLLVRSTLTKAAQDANPSLSSAEAISLSGIAGKYANDILARGMQYALGSESLDVVSLLGGDSMSEMENKLMDLAKETLKTSIALAERELDPSKHVELEDFDSMAFIQEFLSDETIRSVLSFYVSAYIGNSYFSHPNEKGHAAMAKVVFSAYENKTNERKELMKTLRTIPCKLAKAMTKCTAKYVKVKTDDAVDKQIPAEQLPDEQLQKPSDSIKTVPSGRQEKIQAAVKITGQLVKNSMKFAAKVVTRMFAGVVKR